MSTRQVGAISSFGPPMAMRCSWKRGGGLPRLACALRSWVRAWPSSTLASMKLPTRACAMPRAVREGAAMAMENVLEVKHVSVDYGSASGAVHAVDDVSFNLKRGQILGLAGESGSGKSTLAYAVARLLRPPAVVTQGQMLYYPRPGL